MQITIRRDQEDVKGIFGGHKGVNFKLFVKASLSEEEMALIDRYKLGEHWLHSWERPTKAGESLAEFISINDLMVGKTIGINSVGEILDIEEHVIEGAKRLKTILEVAQKFGGEEVIEI